jgi:hypothetical protein
VSCPDLRSLQPDHLTIAVDLGADDDSTFRGVIVRYPKLSGGSNTCPAEARYPGAT